MDVLRKFYWEAYGLVRAGAPHWMYVMDSSFRGAELGRDNFMRGCPNKVRCMHACTHASAFLLPNLRACTLSSRV